MNLIIDYHNTLKGYSVNVYFSFLKETKYAFFMKKYVFDIFGRKNLFLTVIYSYYLQFFLPAETNWNL